MPPAQQCSGYICFGKFKRWPPLPLETPRHLHNNAQHIFGLENFKMAATTSCNATPPEHGRLAYICLENLKDGRHYDFQRHATCTTMLSINLKDGRHYLLQCHATCTTMRRIYWFGKFKYGRHYLLQRHAPAHGRSAYIWFGKFKRWPSLILAMPRLLHNNAQHIFCLENF
jgi:hypothetical protein